MPDAADLPLDDLSDALAAQLLHLRARGLTRGEPVTEPLVMTTTYHLPGDPAGSPAYGRTDNPVWQALEEALGHLEQAETLVFPSGMAAISAAILALVRPGERLLIPEDGYHAVRAFADRFLVPMGIAVDRRPVADFAAGGFDGYRMVLLETPSNPWLDLCDIAAIAGAVHAAGGLLAVDNTVMTPFGQRPLDHGADLVLAADTKAPAGHSDVLVGHVSGRDAALMAAVRDWRTLSGSIPGPFECWQALKGLETLELRLSRMCASAGLIAGRLAADPRIGVLRYPGLGDPAAAALAGRQLLQRGFLIGIGLADAAAAERFIDSCPLLVPATSFGGVHSSAERRARWGDEVPGGYIRLSVGIEPAEELWAAIDRALEDR